MLAVTIPGLVLPSVANLREHWAAKHRRTKHHRDAAYLNLRAQCKAWPANLPLPATVTIVRIAPRWLDDDNMQAACKALRDGVADFLAVNDNDPRVAWRYVQEKGQPAVRIEVA